jgi:hypothetical protein
LHSQTTGNTDNDGDVAQSVEQRTENPCVGGSIPSITTLKIRQLRPKVVTAFFFGKLFVNISDVYE